MLNFPSNRVGWDLQAVGILAVLGEGNIKINALLICLSRTCLLPHLLPAPQGLLVERRARTLQAEEDIIVRSIFSGNVIDGLGYFANILHGPGDGDYVCRVIDLEENPDESYETPCFHLRNLSPLNVIAVSSFLLSIGLVVWAAVIQDGAAVVGIILMSMASPLLCVGSYWKLFLPVPRGQSLHVPKGDVIFRTPSECITVVHCNEAVARAVYFPPRRLHYVFKSWLGLSIGGIGGGLTMIGGIIMLSNSTWTMQAALVVAYALLNIAYWFAAVISLRMPRVFWHWRIKAAIQETQGESYLHVLWLAIQASRTTSWALQGDFIPQMDYWKDWLAVAESHIDDNLWDYQTALQDAIRRQQDKAAETFNRNTSGNQT